MKSQFTTMSKFDNIEAPMVAPRGSPKKPTTFSPVGKDITSGFGERPKQLIAYNLATVTPILVDLERNMPEENIFNHIKYPHVGSEILRNAIKFIKAQKHVIHKLGLNEVYVLHEYFSMDGNRWIHSLNDTLDTQSIQNNIQDLKTDFYWETAYSHAKLAKEFAQWTYALSVIKFIIDKRWEYSRNNIHSLSNEQIQNLINWITWFNVIPDKPINWSGMVDEPTVFYGFNFVCASTIQMFLRLWSDLNSLAQLPPTELGMDGVPSRLRHYQMSGILKFPKMRPIAHTFENEVQQVAENQGFFDFFNSSAQVPTNINNVLEHTISVLSNIEGATRGSEGLSEQIQSLIVDFRTLNEELRTGAVAANSFGAIGASSMDSLRSGFSSLFDNASGSIGTLIEKVIKLLPIILPIVTAIVGCLYLYDPLPLYRNILFALGPASAFANWKNISVIPEKVLALLMTRSEIDHPEEPIPEEMQPANNQFGDIYERESAVMKSVEMLGSILALNGFSIPEPKAWGQTLSRLSSTRKGLDEVITTIFELIREILSTVKKYIGLETPFVSDIDLLRREIEDLVAEDSVKGIPYDRETYLKVSNIIHLGDEMILSLARSGRQQLCPVLRRSLDDIHKIRQKIQIETNINMSQSNAAVAVFLYGGSGTGKSEFAKFLSQLLCRIMFRESPMMTRVIDSSPRTLIYTRGEDEFMEGAKNSNQVVIYPDMYQERTIVGGDSPGVEFIRMTSGEGYYPKMASIEKKDTTLLCPKFVVATSNLNRINDATIESKEAFARRLDFIVKVTFNPEFNEIKGKEFNPDAYIFEIARTNKNYEFITHKAPQLNWVQLVIAIWECYEDKKKYVDRTMITARDATATFLDRMSLKERIVHDAARVNDFNDIDEFLDMGSSPVEIEEDVRPAELQMYAPGLVDLSSDDDSESATNRGEGSSSNPPTPPPRSILKPLRSKSLPEFNDGNVENKPEMIAMLRRQELEAERRAIDLFRQREVIKEEHRVKWSAKVADEEMQSVPRSHDLLSVPVEPVRALDQFNPVFGASVHMDSRVSTHTTPPGVSRVFSSGASFTFLNNTLRTNFKMEDLLGVHRRMLHLAGRSVVLPWRRVVWMLSFNGSELVIDPVKWFELFLNYATGLYWSEQSVLNKIRQLGWDIKQMTSSFCLSILRNSDLILKDAILRAKVSLKQAVNDVLDVATYFVNNVYNATIWFNNFVRAHKWFFGATATLITIWLGYRYGIPGRGPARVAAAIEATKQGVRYYRKAHKDDEPDEYIEVLLDAATGQYHDPKAMIGRRAAKLRKGVTKTVRQVNSGIQRYVADNQFGVESVEKLMEIYKNNMLDFSVEIKGSRKHLFYGLGLLGRVFEIPSHTYKRTFIFWEESKLPKEEWNLLVTFRGVEYKVNMGQIHVLVSDEDDTIDLILASIQKPVNMPEFRNILNHLMTQDEFDKYVYNSHRRFEGKIFNLKQEHSIHDAAFTQSFPVNDIVDGEKVTQFRECVLMYRLRTVAGDCGSVIISTDGPTAGKILGYHIMANDRDAFAAMISKELIEEGLNIIRPENEKYNLEIPDVAITYPTLSPEPQSYDLSVHNGEILTMNLTPRSSVYIEDNLVPYKGRGRKYMDRFREITDTSPGMYYYARLPYGPRENNVNLRYLQAVVEHMSSKFLNLSTNYRRTPLSLKEAISGLEETGLRRLDPNTSAGYPWNAEGITKKDIFMFDLEGDLVPHKYFNDFKAVVQKDIDILTGGGEPIWIYTDTLKSELRKISKERKPRLVSASCLQNTVITRIFLGSFALWMNEAGIRAGTAIGLNPYKDWPTLTMMLQRVSKAKNMMCGDFKGFDTSHMEPMIRAVCDIVLAWYGEASDQYKGVLRTIIMNNARTLHARGPILEMWKFGMASGHPMTTHMNCLINLILFNYFWLVINNGSPMALPEMDKHLCPVVLGDDNICAVSEEYKTRCTERTFADVVKELGYDYTSADKTEITDELKGLTEITFLKRSWRWCVERQQWVAPLDLNVVMETPMWTRRGAYLEVACDNAEVARRELALHGRETFEDGLRKIVRYFDNDYIPSTSSYLASLDEVLNEEGLL